MDTGASRNVLVCSYDHDLSDALRVILEAEGYDVSVAETVDDGLALLRASRDGMVVIWDATPEVGGLDLLSAVLDDEVVPARHAYVLLTTGPAAQLSALTRLLPTLTMSVVAMPFQIQTLFRSVARAPRPRSMERPTALAAIR